MMRLKLLFGFLFVFILNFETVAQIETLTAVKSIDGIVKEGLKIISGERGESRNWESFRILFTPNAQLSVLNHDSLGNAKLNTYSLEEFVRIGMHFYEGDGFLEFEITKTVDEYNGIAHVFQSYGAEELELVEEGINSYQLIYDGERWWITNLLWTSNRNGIELDSEYKKAK